MDELDLLPTKEEVVKGDSSHITTTSVNNEISSNTLLESCVRVPGM